MPMPATYRQASREWRAILADVREVTGLVSDNHAYTVVEAVLKVFRRRLTPQQVAEFADVLPAVPRAIFVSGWDLSEGPVAPGSRPDWTAEAQALRPHHSLTPDNAVEAVAIALRGVVRGPDLDRALGRLPPFAAEFWATPSRPGGVAARIV